MALRHSRKRLGSFLHLRLTLKNPEVVADKGLQHPCSCSEALLYS